MMGSHRRLAPYVGLDAYDEEATVDVNGKVVLITGAARGIGADVARRLAARGARLALVGLEGEQLAAVAAECGGRAWEADVTDWKALETAVAGVVEHFGGIDVVVANAGIASDIQSTSLPGCSPRASRSITADGSMAVT